MLYRFNDYNVIYIENELIFILRKLISRINIKTIVFKLFGCGKFDTYNYAYTIIYVINYIII